MCSAALAAKSVVQVVASGADAKAKEAPSSPTTESGHTRCEVGREPLLSEYFIAYRKGENATRLLLSILRVI
ncbi:hypothetical protein V6N11_078780 [Hibiscus sabdariffa]|uniref:Secreted protein n=1 Tax=Hibiscus sabdariffa TaxID=183260 RepID=A0ABR2RTF6_9ROSI